MTRGVNGPRRGRRGMRLWSGRFRRPQAPVDSRDRRSGSRARGRGGCGESRWFRYPRMAVSRHSAAHGSLSRSFACPDLDQWEFGRRRPGDRDPHPEPGEAGWRRGISPAARRDARGDRHPEPLGPDIASPECLLRFKRGHRVARHRRHRDVPEETSRWERITFRRHIQGRSQVLSEWAVRAGWSRFPPATGYGSDG